MYRGSDFEVAAGPADACAHSGGADRISGPAETNRASIATVRLPFQVGARTVARVSLRLSRLAISLEEALDGALPPLPSLPGDADGYLIRAVPEGLQSLLRADRTLRVFVRQSYVRYYAELDQPFDAYFADMSGNSRSTLRRKMRKLSERCGGKLDIRLYRRPEEMEEFHAHARAVSQLTYQERLLDAGLPEESLAEAVALAAEDRLRAWLLFIDDVPVSYLYLPVAGDTLIYHQLGYDPAFARWSPGSVLQLEAMRMLMEERRFRRIDFTEGDGQHKRQFANGSIPSADLMLLRPRLRNLAAAHALQGFDSSVSLAKRLLERLGLYAAGRAMLR